MNLQGKVALVTGGTRGIGAAAALLFAEAGADVAIVGRRQDDEAAETKRRIEKFGRRCELLIADCGVQQSNAQIVRDTASRLGSVDVVVHCAGGPVPGGLLELNPDDWYAAFDCHVHAIFHLCREAIPMMQKKKEGAIILISSPAGLRGLPVNIAYQVVKGALPQFTRALAREFANDNIRVNCVVPGVIRTAFHASMTPEQKKLNLEQRIPLHREGTPDQVATVIRELVTNDYITGEVFVVDGGLSMRIA